MTKQWIWIALVVFGLAGFAIVNQQTKSVQPAAIAACNDDCSGSCPAGGGAKSDDGEKSNLLLAEDDDSGKKDDGGDAKSDDGDKALMLLACDDDGGKDDGDKDKDA